MKKTVLALILSCVLALSCACSLAETAAQTSGVNFGDFSMAIDPDMYSQVSEKAESSVWFILYPAYNATGDSSTNFNAVWSKEYRDLSLWKDSDAADYINEIKTEVETQYTQYGIELVEFSVPSIQLMKLDEKDALACLMVSKIRYSGAEFSVYQIQAIASDPAFGTYTFTGSAQSEELLVTYIDPLFDAIT